MAVKIKEIARMAGVSPTTVSRVLNGHSYINAQTRQKVLDVIRENNYRPNSIAKGLKDRHINSICLMLPTIQNIAYAPITQGVEDEARERGYTVILCNTSENKEIEKQYIDKMQSLMIDGFVSTSITGNHEYLTRIRDSGVPVVLCSRYNEEDVGRFEICSIDNFKASRIICRHLIDCGYRRIALALGNENIFYSKERYRGYRQALEDAGLPFNEKLVMHFKTHNQDFYQQTVDLIRSGEPFDSVFCTSDGKALYVMRALHEYGFRIPDDIGVAGFDNIDISSFMEPPLTTVSQSPYETGRLACHSLINQIEYKRANGELPPPQFHEMIPELIIRKSTREKLSGQDSQ